MALNQDVGVLAIFAKKLTNNDQRIRSKNLKKLKQLLTKLSDDVPELSMLQLWKGLHYVMWMADKPLVQEQLANELACMIHFLPSKDLSIRYMDAFLKISRKEWHLLDNFRQDKFLRLNRFVIRQALIWLKNIQWESEFVEKFCRSLERCFLSKEGVGGDLYHILDLILPEIDNVMEGQVPEQLVKSLCDSFIHVLSKVDSKYLAKAIKADVFNKLKDEPFKVDAAIFQEKAMSMASLKDVKNRALLYSLIK